VAHTITKILRWDYIPKNMAVKRLRREGTIGQFLWSNWLRDWSSKSSNPGAVEVVEHWEMLGEPLFCWRVSRLRVVNALRSIPAKWEAARSREYHMTLEIDGAN